MISQRSRGTRDSLIEAARSIAFVAWIVAAVSIPVAFLLRAYSTALLIVILLIFWQLLAGLASALMPVRRGRSRSRFHYAMTSWGVVYCAITATFTIVSVQWGLNLVYLACAFLLAGAACAAVLPRLMLARTDATWGLPPRIYAGDPFGLEFTLHNGKRLLSAFGLSVGVAGQDGGSAGEAHRIMRLAPGGEHRMNVHQFLPARGLHRVQPVAVRSTFPFGLIETTLLSRLDDEVLVLPHLGRIRQDVLRRHKGGEARWLLDLRRKDEQGEFRSMREYQHGDNVRLIHWPTSARLHKLYVREFEERETHSLLLLLDAYLPADDPAGTRAGAERFEKAVSFAATMAGLLTEAGIFYAFASYCPDLVTLPYDIGQGHFHSVLEALAVADPTSEHTLAALVGGLSLSHVSTGGVCLVTPGPVAPEQARAVLGPLAHCAVRIDASDPEFDEIYTA
jgi:uncharacterized protein (DUF58 family)